MHLLEQNVDIRVIQVLLKQVWNLLAPHSFQSAGGLPVKTAN